MSFFAKALATIGAIVAATASVGCVFGYFDEAEMPESLL